MSAFFQKLQSLHESALREGSASGSIKAVESECKRLTNNNFNGNFGSVEGTDDNWKCRVDMGPRPYWVAYGGGEFTVQDDDGEPFAFLTDPKEVAATLVGCWHHSS